MTTSGKDTDKGSITARLVDLISNMPMEAQEILLTRLEEKLRMDERKYPRKPYLKEVEFATEDRVYQEFIQDISTGGFAFYTAQLEKCVNENVIDSGTIIGDDFCLSGLPLERIFESVSERGRYSIKRHGVKFDFVEILI